ncbi:unnamed protein product [Clavelina lepadiformis]|uniref:Uncharacterized protein n=1 Tax=Clavelina lepadiformis TaxID=159417 RepID=A0ABP0F0B6_CLALP
MITVAQHREMRSRAKLATANTGNEPVLGLLSKTFCNFPSPESNALAVTSKNGNHFLCSSTIKSFGRSGESDVFNEE